MIGPASKNSLRQNLHVILVRDATYTFHQPFQLFSFTKVGLGATGGKYLEAISPSDVGLRSVSVRVQKEDVYLHPDSEF